MGRANRTRLVDYRAIDEDARARRSQLGVLEQEPLPDIASLAARLDDCGLVIWPLGPAGPDGSYLRQAGLKVIVLNSDKYYPRFRFTAAHHIGHAHYDDQAHLDVDGRSGRVLQEVRANAFAARLLVPTHALEAEIGSTRPTPKRVLELALRFGTSYEVIVNRLNNMGLITPWLRDQLARRRRSVLADDIRNRTCGQGKVLSGIPGRAVLEVHQVPELRVKPLPTLLHVPGEERKGAEAG